LPLSRSRTMAIEVKRTMVRVRISPQSPGTMKTAERRSGL
jgi:hypothetical protein